MVQGIGGLGGSNSGSIKDITEYQVYYPKYQNYVKANNSTLSFESWLIMNGYVDRFTQKVENYLETGNADLGDDSLGNTLNADRHLSNGKGAIYQSQDDDCFYEFDYADGTYRKLENKEEAAKAIGLPNGNNVDTIKLGYNKAQITDYTFGNLDDGQDSQKYGLMGRYSGVLYTQQEFDLHYIFNALLMDPSDPQYQIAKQCFDDLCENLNQWMPASDQAELDAVAAEYGVNSVEYKNKLKELMLKNLDQAQEWIEEHSHVKNVNEGILQELEAENGVTGSESVSGSDSANGESEIPGYDKSRVLNDSGVLGAYTQGTWVSEKVSWKNDAGKNSDVSRQKAGERAIQFATDILDKIEAALISQYGSECTEEIKNYISKAKTTALSDKRSSWLSTERNSAWLGKNRGHYGKCNTKVLVDTFFDEFDTLCKNKGKTSAEVEAEKAAAEEKKSKEKSAYQTLYNMDMKSTAAEADANKNIQVVNANSAAEIKSKAEYEILGPLKSKIRSKMANSGISDADLNTLLNNAATAALADCTDWATASNDYVYTIDANKLINMFEDNVKTIIKNRGYEF